MTITNYILIIVGALVALVGVLSIFFPGLTRIVNTPGGERIKSISAISIGLILFVIGIVIDLPVN